MSINFFDVLSICMGTEQIYVYVYEGGGGVGDISNDELDML